jgi:8-oxo-dGTP pyrophosphatase MutT (NUDIX family)
MKSSPELHPAQVHVLRTLLFTPETTFSQLLPSDITSDHFTFHLKSLLEARLVTKLESGRYTLTDSGKEFANRLDTDKRVLERQAKVTVLLVPVRQRAGQTEYLVQRRLKQPFYGHIGFASGKIGWGESVLTAAARELSEETGLTAQLRLCGVKHKMDTQQGKLLEDKFFFVVRCDVTDETGFVSAFEGGSNHWHTRQEIAALHPLFDGVDGSIEMVSAEGLSFVEATYEVATY